MRKMSHEPLLNEYIFNIFAFNTTFIGDVQYLKKKAQCREPNHWKA